MRSTTPVDDHLARVEVRSSTPVRILAAAQLALFGDDGAEPAVVRRDVDGTAGAGRVAVGGDAGRVWFEWASAPTAETDVGGDECLFADGLPRGLPWLTFTARPRRSGP